ncbi:hypothetical protein, partial [Streptomyces sp. NBC_01264]
ETDDLYYKYQYCMKAVSEAQRPLLAKTLASESTFSMAKAAALAGMHASRQLEDALFHRKSSTKEALAWGAAYKKKIKREEYNILLAVFNSKNEKIVAAIKNLELDRSDRKKLAEYLLKPSFEFED